MAINFRLTLASEASLNDAAALAAPEATEIPAVAGRPRIFSADLYEPHGYAITISEGKNGYYSADDDNGSNWEWEPAVYVNFSFHMRYDLRETDIPNMLTSVARILTSYPEDAALIQDGNWLLLTRFDGKLRKHNLTAFWQGTAFNDIVAA